MKFKVIAGIVGETTNFFAMFRFDMQSLKKILPQ